MIPIPNTKPGYILGDLQPLFPFSERSHDALALGLIEVELGRHVGERNAKMTDRAGWIRNLELGQLINRAPPICPPERWRDGLSSESPAGQPCRRKGKAGNEHRQACWAIKGRQPFHTLNL